MSNLQEHYISTVSPPKLTDTLEHLWDEVQAGDSPVSDEAAQVITRNEIQKMQGAGISIERDSSGLTPAETTVIVTFASHIARDLWQYVFLPRIRQRWGDGSVKRSQETETEQEKENKH